VLVFYFISLLVQIMVYNNIAGFSLFKKIYFILEYSWCTVLLVSDVQQSELVRHQYHHHHTHVRLCATPQTAVHQAPQSLGFSRQEHWSGLPFPSPMNESEKWKWSHSVVSYSSRPHGLQPTRLLCPWDFPGKSTGVGCHCLLRLTCIHCCIYNR